IVISSRATAEDLYGGEIILEERSRAKNVYGDSIYIEDGARIIGEIQYTEEISLEPNVHLNSEPKKTKGLPRLD
ncbi:MAG: hypothetical protein ACTSPC_09865, partial [Candidatus Heimdallarchaeota archaeon]